MHLCRHIGYIKQTCKQEKGQFLYHVGKFTKTNKKLQDFMMAFINY